MINSNFNILRLTCLIQDRDSQDLKRTILSIVFEILYENGNVEVAADDLYVQTNEKFNSSIEKDLFDALLVASTSFEMTNTDQSPLVKLTSAKYNEIDRNILEFSIDPHITEFLKINKTPASKKDKIIEILYQSIYENIYTFSPNNIKSLIPQNISEKLLQEDLDLFNKFLDHNDHNKNKCLYNQFAKAIEFAILTSGKGVTQFSENLYTGKSYLLDTNIIFRMIGVGGEERQKTINQLLRDCIAQGIKFEYSHHTIMELNKKLEQSVIEIKRAEKTNKIVIIEDVLENHPHLFNEDFVTLYCRLRYRKIVSNPEHYELEMKARFKQLCKEFNIALSNNRIKIEDYERNGMAQLLIKKRKEQNEFFRYSLNQAKVDAYNVLHVRKSRGSNNYNYTDVKSFYLTTDRGLNKILSNEKNVLIPETILPSQLFLIHNPISNSQTEEPDYDMFFKFIKRRTSEFKLRGKDVINYITQARLYTTNDTAIASLIEAFSDQRYNYTTTAVLEEGVLITFKDFSKTYFDKKSSELDDIKFNYENIMQNSKDEVSKAIAKSKTITRCIDLFITFIIIPAIALIIKLYTTLDIYLLLVIFCVAEFLKYLTSTRTQFTKNVWRKTLNYLLKRSSYFKLSKDQTFIDEGLKELNKLPDSIWK